MNARFTSTESTSLKHAPPTTAGIFATFCVWAVAALLIRFGSLVTGPELTGFNFIVALVLLFSSFSLGPRLASWLGMPGEVSDEMTRAQVGELQREAGSAARTQRPLGALGCAAFVLSVALVGYGLWHWLH